MTTLRERWIAALRSGEYKKSTSSLKTNDGTAFCCLGVLAELVDPNGWADGGGIRGDRLQWRGQSYYVSEEEGVPGLPLEASRKLAVMNDNGKTFPEIADYIEAHPEIDPRWPEGVAE